ITGLSNTGPFDPNSSYDPGQVATVGQLATPLTFEGDNGSSNGFDRSLGETVHVEGGASGALTNGNIGVEGNGTDTLSIKLAEDVNLGSDGSLTTGNAVVDNGGLAVDDGTNNTIYGADGLTITGGPTISSAGIDAGDSKITNVADGEVSD